MIEAALILSDVGLVANPPVERNKNGLWNCVLISTII